MDRRDFLRRSFYSGLALSVASCNQKSTQRSSIVSKNSITESNFHHDLLISGERLQKPAVLNSSNGILNIVETQKKWFKDGHLTNRWAYQNASNATMIDVMSGDTVNITVNNLLPESTTVHWHGIDVPASQDGHPHHAIEPQQSRTYTFIAPDSGTYWYHPHPHGRTAMQVARGLAAPIIVRSPDDPLTRLNIPEHILFFSTITLDRHGQITPQTMDEQMNGREGNVILINEQYQPVLTVAPGSMHRLRLINASNARYLHLSFGDVDMTIVGTDGGLLERPLKPQQEILLAPAERLEVCVIFENSTTLKALPYDKGWMDSGMGSQKPILQTIDVLQVNTVGKPVIPPKLPKKLRHIMPLGGSIITRRIVLTEDMHMSMAGGKHSMTMKFMINGHMFDMDRIDFVSQINDIELWEIINQTDMDHPFHIHGSHFQVVSTIQNNVNTPYPYLAWKDTINIRSKQIIRLKIMQKHPGLRMFHCHILEHEDLGMMGQYNILA